MVEKLAKMASKAVEANEKPALQSKKFVAYLVAEVGFFVLMGMMLFRQDMDSLAQNTAFLVLAITAGFLAAAYIGGQALVDKYVRVAQITTGRVFPTEDSDEEPKGGDSDEDEPKEGDSE